MSYNSSAQVFITNNSGGNAVITLSHRYSTDSIQEGSWQVAPGQVAGPLTVGYNTGFIRTGMDWWWVGIQVLDGANAGYYSSEGSADDPGKECMLESDDNGKKLYFSVDTGTFVIQEISGSCSTGMTKKTTNQAIQAKASANKTNY